MKEMDVKEMKWLNRSIPQHDYSPAVQGALSWLGKRYLLAEPVNRRNQDRQPPAASLFNITEVVSGGMRTSGR